MGLTVARHRTTPTKFQPYCTHLNSSPNRVHRFWTVFCVNILSSRTAFHSALDRFRAVGQRGADSLDQRTGDHWICGHGGAIPTSTGSHSPAGSTLCSV